MTVYCCRWLNHRLTELSCVRPRLSAERPLQVGRIDACTSWPAVRVTKTNGAHQRALVLFGRADKLPVNAIQHPLGSTKHDETIVVIHVAPSQVEEAIATFAMNHRTPEVHRCISSEDDSNIKFPAGGDRVAGDEVEWFLPDMNPDADVVERMAMRIAEGPSRKISAFDHNSHTRVSHGEPTPRLADDCQQTEPATFSRSSC